MEPKLIDLNDYILTGGGFMGESYNHKDNPELMLKVYPLDWTRLADKEYDCAKKAFAVGIPEGLLWRGPFPGGTGRGNQAVCRPPLVVCIAGDR